MALSVALYPEDVRVRDSRKPGIPPPKTGWDEPSGLQARLKTLVEFWESFKGPKSQASGLLVAQKCATKTKPNVGAYDLFRPYRAATWDIAGPPPSYEDSFQDVPPDYTATDAFANAQNLQNATIPSGIEPQPRKRTTGNPSLLGQVDVKIDFSNIENIRSHGKKKAKQATKQAQLSKWDDDGEEKKDDDGDGGDGGSAGGNGGGGAGSGGDDGGGGKPPGDGGDDDDEWWNAADAGGKKSKKKKKKNA